MSYQPTTGGFEEAVLRMLHSRGMVDIPGLDPDPDEERRQALRDLADWNRYLNSGEYEAQREAERQAELAAQNPPPSLPEQIMGWIAAQSPSATPLNSDALVRAAAGENGTIERFSE